MARYIAPLVFGIAGVAVLLALGTWQLQRLGWKQGVLAEIEHRIAAEPVSLPAAPERERDRYLPVFATGTTQPPEILVQSSLKAVGPGFRVIVPFETGGRRILLDRGFIRLTDRDNARPAQTMTVSGNLHWPDEVDGFTPDPDIEGGLWFARDVDALAQQLDTEPVLLVARSTDEPQVVVTPLPVDTSGIPNNHLQYAITWFLLALVWAGMTLFLVRSMIRSPRKG